MPKYTFQAINESGNTFTDVLEADSIDMANNIITARGYIPVSVAEEGGAAGGAFLTRIKESLTPIRTAELILFTKQFRTMLRAGVSMVKLLQVLENQSENPVLKRIIIDISNDIKEGYSLYDAFSKHPRAFSPLYCGMVQAGEASGALPDILDRLLYIIDHENKIKSDIRAALQYPMIVVCFLAIAFFILLTFVIPKFVGLFIRSNIALPLPTRICMLMYKLLADYWFILIGGVVAVIVAATYYLRTEQGKYMRDAFLLQLPVFGSLFVKAAMSRFASIFAILQSSGVAVLESMKILSRTIGNAAISREFEQITERLAQGRGIAEPLKSAKYFTPIVINMVAIGEESGSLDEMLREISEHYDVELEYAMKKLSDAIAPILTVGLAAVVGFFALAIFLPMWDLTKMAH
ncbi:MAG: type II secretion system F family protein [Thermodesulfobacteriota bacterium]